MTKPVNLGETRACLCLAARREARLITRLFDAKLRPHGLRSTQFSVLATLAVRGPSAVNELARFLDLERTTLTRIGAVLERDGLVRVASSDDARERPLAITPAGRRKIEAAFPSWKQAQELVLRRGTPTSPQIEATP